MVKRTIVLLLLVFFITKAYSHVITGSGRYKNGKLYFYVTDNAFKRQKYYCECGFHQIRTTSPNPNKL